MADNIPDPWADNIEDLIEASSLGTKRAKRLPKQADLGIRYNQKLIDEAAACEAAAAHEHQHEVE